MAQEDWTPALLITASLALVTAALVWVVAPAQHAGDPDATGTMHPRRHMAADVTLWVGELAPGLTAVLTSVFGDPQPDLEHDADLNGRLGLDGLGFYRLLVFNTSEEPHTFELKDGALAIRRGDERTPCGLKNLARMVERGEVQPADGLEFSLDRLGALRLQVEIPPGEMANLVLGFGCRVSLDEADGVQTSEGTPFRRLPISRAKLRRLMEDPRVETIEKL